MAWAKEGIHQYSKIRDDLVQYKKDVKDTLERYTQKNNEIVMTNGVKIDKIMAR